MLDPKNLLNGEEQFEEFKSFMARKVLIQYDYRNEYGQLFSIVRPTLEECRKSRDVWELGTLKNMYMDVCDRIHLNEQAQGVRYCNSSKLRESLSKDYNLRDELKRKLGIEDKVEA